MKASEILSAQEASPRYRQRMAFKDNLIAAMKAANVTQSDLARLLKPGVTPAAVNQWCAGTSMPTHKRLENIASVLETTVNDLLTPVSSKITSVIEFPNAKPARNAPPLPDFQSYPRDIPVMGGAQGGPDGSFHLNMEGPVDWARRPPALAGITTVFAIYCEGDSMTPWRQPGELIYVSKTRPPQPGSHVVVVFEAEGNGDPPVAYVKKLVRRTSDRIDLEQYNPPAGFSLPVNRVREILRVLEWSEVLGI